MENFQISAPDSGARAGSAPVSVVTYTDMRPVPRFSATSIASMARAFSTLRNRNRSATTSSIFRGPVGVATSRSAWTRVKPLAASHCSSSCADVPPGSSTGKVITRRGSAAAVRAISSA